MQIIEVDESIVVRASTSVVVAHSRTRLTRGLEPGEQVVLLTAAGDYYAAQVGGIEFDLEDTRYNLDVGARLPEELARERIEGLDPQVHDLSLHELVDLLGDLAVGHEAG